MVPSDSDPSTLLLVRALKVCPLSCPPRKRPVGGTTSRLVSGPPTSSAANDSGALHMRNAPLKLQNHEQQGFNVVPHLAHLRRIA